MPELIELKNGSEAHTIEEFMKTKNVSQENQLQEFIMQNIKLKNNSKTSYARRYQKK